MSDIFHPSQNPIRVEFGCNGRKLDGWLGLDIDDGDIRKPLNFDTCSVAEVHASHVSEHVTSAECSRFFTEVYRILRHDGVFRVIVPAIGLHMKREHVRDLCEGHGHCQSFSFENLRAMLYGAGFEVDKIRQTDRKPMDDHHTKIGEDKDYAESLRVEAVK